MLLTTYKFTKSLCVYQLNLQGPISVPDDGVGVVILCGIKPKPVLLLSSTFPFGVHIGVQGIGLTGAIPQELKVDLIMGLP
jgi:hypothetical protein